MTKGLTSKNLLRLGPAGELTLPRTVVRRWQFKYNRQNLVPHSPTGGDTVRGIAATARCDSGWTIYTIPNRRPSIDFAREYWPKGRDEVQWPVASDGTYTLCRPDVRDHREPLRAQAASRWRVEGIPGSYDNVEPAPPEGDPALWRAHLTTHGISSEKRRRSRSPQHRAKGKLGRQLPAHLAEPAREDGTQRNRVNTTTMHWGSETMYHAPGMWNTD